MHVKWLEMYGFKSFCEKIKINFDKGITAIVGPNGSGKSNITDAIRWVLGEQSLRILRASKMEDLIFAGTEKRKSLGFSEVSICFDNSDKNLNIDFEEVVITRRMFKTAENEYYINKTSCRLKDVSELLLDTGLGKDGYSIISQGKVDEIINARPFERYRIFEEACGITKYKYRKEETERKLKNTQDNILRLQDIINELLAQIEEIRPDVQKARIFKELNQKLLWLKKEKYIYSYNSNYQKFQSILNQIEINEKLLNNLKKDCSFLEDSLNEKTQVIDSFKIQLEKLNQNQIELRTLISDDTSKLKFAKNQFQSKQNLVDEIDDELYRLSFNKDSKEKELRKLQSTYNETEIKNKELINKIEQVSQQLGKIKDKLNQLESELQQDEVDLIEYISQIEKNTQKVNGLLHLKGNLLERKKQIELEEVTIGQELKSLNAELSKNLAELDITSQHKKETEKKLDEVNSRINYFLNIISNLKKELDSISKDVVKKQEKLNIFESMDENLEGYNKAVKEIFKRVKNSSIRVYGTVGNLISVQKKYIKAIDSALGSSIQYIVVQDEEDAKNIIEIAKKERLGKVTIVPIDTVSILTTKDKIAFDGFLGYADELVQTDGKYKRVVELLLGRTLVFDTIDSAIKYQKECSFKSRCVTLSGELINAGGIFVGGEKKVDFSILERKVEKEELKKELFDLESKAKFLEDDVSKRYEQLEKFNIDKAKVEEDLKTLTKKIDDLKKANDIVMYKKNQLEQKKEVLKKEKDLIDKQIAEIEKDSESVSELLTEIEENKKDTEGNIQFLREKIQILKSDYDTLSSQYKDMVERKNEHQMILNITEHKINEIIKSRQEIEEQISKKLAQKQKLNDQMIELSEQIKILSSEIEKNQDLLKQIRLEINQVECEYNNYVSSYQKNVEEIKQLKEKIYQAEKEINELNLEKTNLENVLLNVKEKYRGLFNCEIETNENINEWDSEKDMEIENISKQIEELGEVNLYSIEQEKKMLERIDFLTKQVDDLNKTSKELKELIEHLDKNMKEVFKENFEKIRIIFNDMFKELFNGGSCDLKLIESDGEFGVDIDVKPPGKKLQNISLLSGGEKALTAIAILFSFLIFKDSVFCILDEIDSSLDEANVQRFAYFLKNFNNKSQIIIVTHRKPTMEIADVLYGVTMEEQGVSKILSLNIENIKRG